MRPKTDGILESSLYVCDIAKSIHFYQKVFGFEVISKFGERGCAMQAGERQVLLLFKKGGPEARLRRTMATANSTSRSPFPRRTCRLGNHG